MNEEVGGGRGQERSGLKLLIHIADGISDDERDGRRKGVDERRIAEDDFAIIENRRAWNAVLIDRVGEG